MSSSHRPCVFVCYFERRHNLLEDLIHDTSDMNTTYHILMQFLLHLRNDYRRFKSKCSFYVWYEINNKYRYEIRISHINSKLAYFKMSSRWSKVHNVSFISQTKPISASSKKRQYLSYQGDISNQVTYLSCCSWRSLAEDLASRYRAVTSRRSACKSCKGVIIVKLQSKWPIVRL